MDTLYFERCWQLTSGSEFDPYKLKDRKRLTAILFRLQPNTKAKTLLELCIDHLLRPTTIICGGATRVPKKPYNAFSLAMSIIDHAALRIVLMRVLTIHLVGSALSIPGSLSSPKRIHETLQRIDKRVYECCFYLGLPPEEFPIELHRLTEEWDTSPPQWLTLQTRTY